MTKAHLKFPQKSMSYRPRFASRYSKHAVVGRFACYRTDGEGDDEDPVQKALLAKIQTRMKDEIEKRGYTNEEAVTKIITAQLKAFTPEALTTWSADKTKLEDSLRLVTAEMEKVKNIRTAVEKFDQKNFLRKVMDKMFQAPKEGEKSPLELMMRSKGAALKEVKLNLSEAHKLETRGAALNPLESTNVINENGFPLEMIESMSILDGVVKRRYGTQYIAEIASRNVVSEIEEYTTWLEEGDDGGAFAIVLEGAVKPLTSKVLVRNFAKAQKIAGKTVITEEFAKFRAKAWTYVKDLLNDKLLRDYNAILTADLQAQAASYVGTSLDGTIVAPTDYDAIGAVAAQIETLNFVPDVLILHPQDRWRLTLEKDSEGRYYFIIPTMNENGIISMMGFRTISSTYQTQGSFTLGESGLFKIEEEAFTIRMGYGIDVTIVGGNVTAVQSDFDTNQMRMIIETYFKNWIPTNYAGSFVTATFTAMKAALLKP